MDSNLKGIHKVKKKLANGQIRIHYYAWRGGPALAGTPGTAEFFESYQNAQRSIRQPDPKTMAFIIALYKSAHEFTGLKPATQRTYRFCIKRIEEDLGSLPIAALSDPKVRGVFKDWRDRLAATPRMADLCWSVLARILSIAKDRGIIARNPCEGGGRLYKANRADIIWTDADLDQFFNVASEPLKAAVMIALWTGQRKGDILRLAWSAYDGTSITLRQSKTGQNVRVPASSDLKALLDALPRTSPVILLNSKGMPWTEDGFNSSFDKARAKAGLQHLNFHDLRGTTVTKLALKGATALEIASLTGHSFKTVNDILEKHYLGGRVELAAAAMAKLDTKSFSNNYHRSDINLGKAERAFDSNTSHERCYDFLNREQTLSKHI